MAFKDDDLTLPGTETDDAAALSRRQLLTAGLAAAGGLAQVKAASAAAASSRMIGVAPTGATAVEFRSRLTQTGSNGENFVAYGYIFRAEGASDDDLFAGNAQNETTALLTAYASGNLVRRVLDHSVHALDIEGTLTIFQRLAPGADFADPGSFQIGTPLARYALTLLDVLSVFAPGKGLPTLTGDMEQIHAAGQKGHDGFVFGHPGTRGRMHATGLGTLVDPITLNAVLEMAGSWTTA